MKSFALTLVASLAAAQTYEESYDGSAEVDGVGTTDFTIEYKIQVEETPDLLSTTASSETIWEVVLEGDDIAANDEVEAWVCYENEACIIMRSVGTDNLSVHYTDAAGQSLPNSDCSAADAQPSQALSSSLDTVATWNGTSVTTGNTYHTELVPDTVSISGKTISMSALEKQKEVTDLAAMREAEEAAAALLAENLVDEADAAEFEDAAGDLGDLEDVLDDLDIDLDVFNAEIEAAQQAAAAELEAEQAAYQAQIEAEYAQAAAEANQDIKQTTGLWVKRAGGAATCAQGEETVKSFDGAAYRLVDEKATYESQIAQLEESNGEDEETEDEETEDEESEDEEAEDDGAYALTTIAAATVAVAALAF